MWIQKNITAKIFITFLLISGSICLHAQKNPDAADHLLIRNVMVIDREGNGDDIEVNMIIENGILELVTRDTISLSMAEDAFDAKGGFILGTLQIGNPASFIILDKDPRSQVEVMLDTRSHTIFAMSNGELILNNLDPVDEESKGLLTGWHSYAPPPVALPISYQNKRKWNVLRTKPVTMILGGAVIMDNTRWFSQDDTNEEQVGDLNEYVGGSVRGFRAGIGGTFNFKKPWTYIFSIGTRAFERGFEQGDLKEFVLYDYRVSIPLGTTTFSLGKMKETFSLSRLSAMIYEPAQQERASVADGLLPARNIGIAFNNTLFEERMTWSAGIFNNWFESDRSFSDNPTVITGRITAVPYITADQGHFLHLGIAGRYSNGAGGIQYKARTEIYSGPVSVDTELLEQVTSTFHYGLEAAYGNGPFTVIGEYMQANVTATANNDPSFKGYYLVASYVLSREMRTYNQRSGLVNRLHIANGVNSGGWGTWEVYTRWSTIDLNDQNITGGKNEYFLNRIKLVSHYSHSG